MSLILLNTVGAVVGCQDEDDLSRQWYCGPCPHCALLVEVTRTPGGRSPYVVNETHAMRCMAVSRERAVPVA